MNYWVYKCNSRGEAAGNDLSGDWEDEEAFGGPGVFDWGSADDVPDLELLLRKGDRVIAHQTDHHKLVGVAVVVGLRNRLILLRPLERIGADMRELKRKYKRAFR